MFDLHFYTNRCTLPCRSDRERQENNRRAKYYELTKSGHKQLEVEKDTWERMTVAVVHVLETI
jgi:DNA-binding PadR family transcriptional regulator